MFVNGGQKKLAGVRQKLYQTGKNSRKGLTWFYDWNALEILTKMDTFSTRLKQKAFKDFEWIFFVWGSSNYC